MEAEGFNYGGSRQVGFGEDCEDAVADVGNNADLYGAANQESTDLINEAHREKAPLRFMRQDVFYYHYQPLSLD